MKNLQIIGKIFSSFLVLFSFGSCTPDCVTCTYKYDGNTYNQTYCESDGWNTEYASSWKDYIDYLKNYFKAYDGKCK